METLATSETLEEEGSVVSQLDRTQQPADKTLEQGSRFSNGLVSASEISVKENGVGAEVSEKDIVRGNVEIFNQIISAEEKVETVEVRSSIGGAGTFDDGNCFGFGGIDKGSFVDDVVFEESLSKGVSLEPTFEGNEVKNGDLSVLEVCSTVFGNEIIGADKVSEESVEVADKKVVKIGDSSVLEVFSTVNANYVIDSDKASEEGVEVADKKLDVSGSSISLFVEVFGPSDGHVEADDSKCTGENVSIGGNLNDENAYKGNGILLPRTGENPSANLDITEHGTLEIEAQTGNEEEGDTISVHKSDESGEFLEAKNFLGYVKGLAKDVAGPTMTECTVTQNRLSAFYQTLGHQQLPMDQLVPSNQEGINVTDEGIISTNLAPKSKKRKRSKNSNVSGVEAEDILRDVIPEKGHESRERRKSKYLSPPYVNLIGSGVPKCSFTLEEHEIEELKELSRSVDSYGKKLQNKSKKHVSGRDFSFNLETINASSAEMLSKLHFTALDCCYPKERNIDLVERYFLGFRKSVYQNIFFRETAEENFVEVTAEKFNVLSEKSRKKSEEKTSAGSKKPKKRQTKEMGDLPDLNQGNNGLPVEGPQVEAKKRKRSSKSKTSETISGLPSIEGSKAKLVPVGIKEAASLDPTNTEHNGNQPKDPMITSDLPDLNGNMAEGKTKRRRRRKKAAGAVVLSTDFDYSKLQTNGEAQGTALLLKFTPESPLPSKEALVSAFSGFGELKESETHVLNESFNAQVVFINNSNARDAFRSLEKSSPFGPSLVNYRLLDLSAASTVLEADFNLRVPQVQKQKSPPKPKRTPVKPRRVPEKPMAPPAKPGGVTAQQKGEVPDLAGIRKRLEVMTTMMEQAGDHFPAETRAKLENDIKGLLAKVSTSG